jgi:hypothetical protein
MLRLFLIIAILFASCAQPSDVKPKMGPVRIDTLKSGLDSASEEKDAFHWDRTPRKDSIALPADFTKYIGKGHVAIDTARCDLNDDGIADLAVVTGEAKEDSLRFSDYDMPRHLLVFLGEVNGNYRFAFRNTKAIPCINCCGMSDPYGGFTVAKGTLVINEYCASNWKNISEYRFHYKPRLNDWLLDTVVTESYSFNYENYALDTTTKKNFGKVSLKTFVMYKDDE